MQRKRFGFVGVALVALAFAAVINLPGSAQAQNRYFDFGTATSTAAAATLNNAAGIITTESLTTAGLADYTFTLTNSLISANCVVHVDVASYAGTGTPAVGTVTAGTGSVVIKIHNLHATAAFNAVMKIAYTVTACSGR